METINDFCDDILFNILYMATLNDTYDLYTRFSKLGNIMLSCKRWLQYDLIITKTIVNELALNNDKKIIDEHAKLLLHFKKSLLIKLKNLNLRVTNDIFWFPQYYYNYIEHVIFICNIFEWCLKEQIPKITSNDYEKYKNMCSEYSIKHNNIYIFRDEKNHSRMANEMFIDSIPKTCECAKCNAKCNLSNCV